MNLFDPLSFLDFASRLAETDSSEAALRTCVGRVYYAIYLFAREKLLSMNAIHSRSLSKSPHGSVIATLKRIDRISGQQLGSLFDLRVEADYRLQPSSSSLSDWLKNWQRANAIAQNLKIRLGRI